MRSIVCSTTAAQLDGELARLGRGAGALRLRLGEALDALTRSDAHHELGFPSLSTYALERCERTGRWAFDTRALARRLKRLPHLRDALRRGELSWSMVELLARHATHETDADLARQALGATVRSMRERLRHEGKRLIEDEDSARRTLRLTLSHEDAWAFEFTRLLIREVSNDRAVDTFVEAIVAEGLTALQTLDRRCADADLGDEVGRQEPVEPWRNGIEECCESRAPRDVSLPVATEEVPLPTTPRALDVEIRRLAAELATRDLRIGQLFAELRALNGWRALGWATEEQYARERVGVSHASLKSRSTLARRSAPLAPVREALEQGRIGYEAASLVARVADTQTAEAWVSRAEGRTLKHLRDEIDAVEMFARATSDASLLAPPDESTMELYADIQRFVLSGGGSVADNSGPLSGDTGDVGSPPEVSQMSGAPVRRGAGRVSIRLNVRQDLYAAWRDLEKRFAMSTLTGSFVSFLCLATWREWSHVFDTRVAYARIYRRERFRCANPVCSHRADQPHHYVYRSQGGTDDDSNVGALCSWCHLKGIHEGRLKVAPPAPGSRWVIGRDPILIIEGRRRISSCAQKRA